MKAQWKKGVCWERKLNWNLERRSTEFVVTASDSNAGAYKTVESVGQNHILKKRGNLWLWGARCKIGNPVTSGL
jgi:hypothetical protein